MARRLTIVGASTRAAAFSAKAAGFETWCADRFADVDLQALGAVERIANYPHGLSATFAAAPQAPWMYTGALENDPDLVDDLARLRPLYGNQGESLRRARDPVFWSRALADDGIPSPRVSYSSAELPRDGSWICKPLRSANGAKVAIWQGGPAARDETCLEEGGVYYQERVLGRPIAAVFVAADGEAALLGITQQLQGDGWRASLRAFEPESHANPSQKVNEQSDRTPFRYCGSIGPILLDDAGYRCTTRLGRVISRACGLVGLFGVDAISNSSGVWPVEINPRYTASIEVLERASLVRTSRRRPRRLLSIELHEAACAFHQLPGSLGQSSECVAGKLIYYAPRDLRFSSATARWVVNRNLSATRYAVADIPAVGSVVHRGEPVLTLLADGRNLADVGHQLRTAADEFETALLDE